MDVITRSFGQCLRQLRLDRGYSIRQFADSSLHSKTLIWEWERDKKVPTADVVERLDELLDGGGILIAAAASSVATPTQKYGETVRLFPHQGPIAAEVRRRAKVAAQLDVLAVRGLGIIGLNDSMLRPALLNRSRPLKVRILLLDPDCESAALRAAEIRESPDAFSAGIRWAIAMLEGFAASESSVDLELGLYVRLPVWRIIRVDDVAWVSTFTAQWEGHESAIYEIPASPTGALWAGYRRQFEEMYANARRII